MNTSTQELYIAMLKSGKSISTNEKGLPEVRIAILADHATQQLANILKACFRDLGFFAHIFAGEFATTSTEIFDSGSSTYEFKPDFVLLGHCLQHYRERFFDCRSPQERACLPQVYFDEIESCIVQLSNRGIKSLVMNLALPVERMFGNFGAATTQSLYGSVLEFNHHLQKASHEARFLEIDVMYLSGFYGSSQFLDEKLWVTAKYLCANRFLPELGANIARVVSVAKGSVKKCIVLDLDNTLWGGVIGDDGIDGISLGHGDAFSEAFQLFQHYIKSLKDRGFILAVCSKNNEDTARSVFRNHTEMVLREEDIAVFVANWNDKASNIEFIAETLNIGLDSLIFLDDSPFERNLVREIFPQVMVLEMPDDVSEYVEAIELSGALEASSYSTEDFNRNQMYREEAGRATQKFQFNNIDDYLRSLAIFIKADPIADNEVLRVAQLLQRSNQFNLRTQRFDEAACRKFIQQPERYITLASRLKDRFGDYGLISVICAEVNGPTLEIKEFVMSCRVLKRGVEEFLINKIVGEAKRLGLTGIRGEYIRSAKNGMVRTFYPSLGFVLESQNEERGIWYLDLSNFQPLKTFAMEE